MKPDPSPPPARKRWCVTYTDRVLRATRLEGPFADKDRVPGAAEGLPRGGVR